MIFHLGLFFVPPMVKFELLEFMSPHSLFSFLSYFFMRRSHSYFDTRHSMTVKLRLGTDESGWSWGKLMVQSLKSWRAWVKVRGLKRHKVDGQKTKVDVPPKWNWKALESAWLVKKEWKWKVLKSARILKKDGSGRSQIAWAVIKGWKWTIFCQFHLSFAFFLN